VAIELPWKTKMRREQAEVPGASFSSPLFQNPESRHHSISLRIMEDELKAPQPDPV
jgi:hypothetical protein